MAGRADQVKYQTGLKKCRNFKVLKHGGVANRSGSQFKVEVKNSSLRTYFIKFVFNADQTYVIEVGNLYMRFIRLGAQVTTAAAAYNGATAYVPGNLVLQGGVTYYCIANTTGNAPPNVTYWYPLTGVIFEIPTPYLTADLARLKFVQSGDVVTITHPTYPVKELTRTGHTAWTLTDKPFAPTVGIPQAVVATAGAAGTVVYRYKVTAVKSETYEESLPSAAAATAVAAVPTLAAPNTIAWTPTAGAGEYNVYRETAPGTGTYAFLGIAAINAFADGGNITPDQSTTPPIARTPFNATDNYPSAVGYYQQRQIFGRTNSSIEKVWTTRTGMFTNLTVSSPLQEDDAVTFTIAGRQVNEVRHIMELDALVILTSGAEWIVLGDSDGILKANQPPNLKLIGSNGASEVVPVIVGNSLVFVQARGSVVRDLRNEVQATGGTSYTGRDLSVFAGHLFRKKTLDRVDYAQIPDSIIWFVRSDGSLLGLTYLRDHEIWGWHTHDTNGWYEDVCVVPEENEDMLYVMVKRIINGVTKRYIERFPSRDFADISVDAIFLDSYLTYDGRNTGSTTLSLSTGAGWTVNDTITVTAALGTPFTAGDVGNWFVLNILDTDPESDTYGDVVDTVTIVVDTFTDTTHVSGTPSKTVPASLRGVATTSWSRAVDLIGNLGHLEAKNISVFADGNVVANPNNKAYTIVTVTGAQAQLDRCYSVIHAGLPFTSDMQTLDLDVNGQPVRGKTKDVTHISLLVESTRGIFAGPQLPEDIPAANRIDPTDLLEGLNELQSAPITEYSEPWPMATGQVEMNIQSTWNESGSFAVRQTDPLPITILAAIPNTEIGG